MIVLELFAGTRSIGKAFERKGHKVISIDWDQKFKDIDYYCDISKLTAKKIIELCGGVPDVIWASPDCTSYSIAGISHHRCQDHDTGILMPVSDYAKFCDSCNRHVLDLINELKPKLYFIENPRGGFRKMDFVRGLYRYTVTYCQYGDDRQKPTDIFTNHPYPCFKPVCHRGDKCHQSAPRGSATGTQGLKGSVERSRIPDGFCDHIAYICEEYVNYFNFYLPFIKEIRSC